MSDIQTNQGISDARVEAKIEQGLGKDNGDGGGHQRNEQRQRDRSGHESQANLGAAGDLAGGGVVEGGAAAVVGGVHIWHVLDKKCQYMFAPRSCCGQMKWGFPRLLKMGEVVDDWFSFGEREGGERE